MFKSVLEDYKNQAWSSLKSTWNTGKWGPYVNMFLMAGILGEQPITLAFYSYMLPLCVGLMLSRMYPNRISKTMLLCPITYEERKKYLLTGYLIRCSIPILLFVMLNMIMVLAMNISVMGMMMPGISLVLFVISVNIYCMPVVDAQGALERVYDLPGYYPIWDVLVQVMGIMGMMLFVLFREYEGGTEELWAVIMIILILVIQIALCIKMFHTYFKPIMEQAVYYDTSYGKEKQNEANR